MLKNIAQVLLASGGVGGNDQYRVTYNDDPLFGEPYPCWCGAEEVAMTYARETLTTQIAELDFKMVKAGRF